MVGQTRGYQLGPTCQGLWVMDMVWWHQCCFPKHTAAPWGSEAAASELQHLQPVREFCAPTGHFFFISFSAKFKGYHRYLSYGENGTQWFPSLLQSAEQFMPDMPSITSCSKHPNLTPKQTCLSKAFSRNHRLKITQADSKIQYLALLLNTFTPIDFLKPSHWKFQSAPPIFPFFWKKKIRQFNFLKHLFFKVTSGNRLLCVSPNSGPCIIHSLDAQLIFWGRLDQIKGKSKEKEKAAISINGPGTLSVWTATRCCWCWDLESELQICSPPPICPKLLQEMDWSVKDLRATYTAQEKQHCLGTHQYALQASPSWVSWEHFVPHLERGGTALDLMKNELEIWTVYVLIYSNEVCTHYSNEHCIEHIINIPCRCQEESRDRRKYVYLLQLIVNIINFSPQKIKSKKKKQQERALFLPTSPQGYLSVSLKFLK